MLKYIKVIFKSFYDSKSFLEVSRNRYNIFVLALIVSIFTSIPKTVFVDIKIKNISRNEIEPILKVLPEFSVKDNALEIKDEKQRFEYKFSDGTEFLLIDSEKNSKEAVQEEEKYIFRIYKDAIVTGNKDAGLGPQALTYNMLGGVFNEKSLVDFAHGMLTFLFYFIIFLFFALDFLVLLLAGLIYFLAGLLFLKMLKFGMPKKNLYSTAVFASVPATIADKMVLSFIGFDFFIIKPSVILCYLLWALLTIRKAVEEYKNQKQNETRDNPDAEK
ncbi:MAG: DUF1189 domain-containing protein [Treponema sp.]|uniref:DUF1189 family protein n=1 Tax=Treponema sp. TaxID=166 RepID=UPI00298D6BB6|nr:DUF1189 family protein [Treponema sp.]MCR5385988.1 DUF1189 domain-containing protein [Treponema sp.]